MDSFELYCHSKGLTPKYTVHIDIDGKSYGCGNTTANMTESYEHASELAFAQLLAENESLSWRIKKAGVTMKKVTLAKEEGQATHPLEEETSGNWDSKTEKE
jgi:hypothetical protein